MTGAGPVPEQLRTASEWAWRLIVVVAAVYLAFSGLARVKLAVMALFAGLVITALLRPLVRALIAHLPRWLAVVLSLLSLLVVVLGILIIAGVTVAGQVGRLTQPLRGGVGKLADWLQTSPLHIHRHQLDAGLAQAQHWVSEHRGQLAGQALGGAGTAAEIFTGLALALFCSIFFLNSGERMWAWMRDQLPQRARAASERAANAAWTTFEGYVRGTILVAASNALIVAVVLLLLRVPLALPLALLVFLASYIPLIGGPIAVAAAALVTLASRGPLTALIVVILIPVIGQIEGHVLQPLIMSRSVRLHPVVVAVAVVCGGLLGGLLGAVLAVPIVAITWAVTSALRSRPSPSAQT